MNDLLRAATMTVGESKGQPRIYLQGDWLTRAGFEPGLRYQPLFDKDCMTLELATKGDYKVSAKGTVPVIDFRSPKITETLRIDKVQVSSYTKRIAIAPNHTRLLMSSRELFRTEGSLFSGGGLLSQAAKLCGFDPLFALEVNPAYAGVYETNHPGATMLQMSVEDASYDVLRQYRGRLGLFTAGIPCEPYSAIRRLDRGGQEKRNKDLPPEAHENGDLTLWAYRAVEATNPHTCVFENVPGFLNSGACHMLMRALQRLRYTLDARIIDPLDHGCLTGRKRAVIIATANKQIVWPAPMRKVRKVAEILDPPHLVADKWFTRETKSWLFEHWDKQTAKGNGFASQIVTENDVSVPTIKKRYCAMQGDNPVLAHPTKPDTYRWFTVNEIRKLCELPDNYELPEAKTLAGEVMGQGVVLGPFVRILQTLLKAA
jgi:DNA (cytosine-5)-methyltransferase 1